jgi:DNA primase
MNPYSFGFLKARVSIGQVLSAYGLDSRLKARGDQLLGPCPLHGGDNPTAFRVHLQRNLWRCFTSCGGGDTVELVRRIHGCSYAQAARHLHRLAEDLPSQLVRPVPASAKRLSSFRPFTRSIPLDPEHHFLQNIKKISSRTALSFEAGTTQSSAFLRNTLAVRLHDIQGHPLGYCARLLLADQIARFGKWRFPKHFPKARILYNAHRAKPFRHEGIIVVECPWASIRLSQAGVPNVVSLLGTQIFEDQIAWLAKAPGILLLLDGDPAGREASSRIANSLQTFTTVYTHLLPDNKEPEDLSDQALAAIVMKYPLSF